MNWVRHGGSTTFETKSSYYRAKVEFYSINWVRHGSSTTFETGLTVTCVKEVIVGKEQIGRGGGGKIVILFTSTSTQIPSHETSKKKKQATR